MAGLQNNPQNNAGPHSPEFSCAWAGEIVDCGRVGRDVEDVATHTARDINGVLQADVKTFSGAPVVLGDFNGIRVGRDIDDAATRDFAGHLDDFRIYGRALAAGEALGLVSPVSTVSRQYVWGLYIDELLQQKNLIGGPSGGAAGQEAGGHYLMSDLLYRAAALVTPDSGETSGVRILENYDFDAYGNTLIFNAPGTDDDWWASDAQQTPTPACRYLFTGREYDAESGLYYYRARFYWPELGRFGQRDPIGYGAGMGLYSYGNSSPSQYLDPSGLLVVINARGTVSSPSTRLQTSKHGTTVHYRQNPFLTGKSYTGDIGKCPCCALVWVHGYGNTSTEAEDGFRLIEKNYKLSGGNCEVYGFSWPSDTLAEFGGLVNPSNFKQSVKVSKLIAKNAFNAFVRDFKKKCPKAKIHLGGHSLGAGVILEALHSAPDVIGIGHVVLANPAVDNESLFSDEMYSEAHKHAQSINVGYSRDDDALTGYFLGNLNVALGETGIESSKDNSKTPKNYYQQDFTKSWGDNHSSVYGTNDAISKDYYNPELGKGFWDWASSKIKC